MRHLRNISQFNEIFCTAHISAKRNGKVGETIGRKGEANQSKEN